MTLRLQGRASTAPRSAGQLDRRAQPAGTRRRCSTATTGARCAARALDRLRAAAERASGRDAAHARGDGARRVGVAPRRDRRRSGGRGHARDGARVQPPLPAARRADPVRRRGPVAASRRSLPSRRGSSRATGRATAYLCVDYACGPPITSPAEFAARLDDPSSSRPLGVTATMNASHGTSTSLPFRPVRTPALGTLLAAMLCVVANAPPRARAVRRRRRRHAGREAGEGRGRSDHDRGGRPVAVFPVTLTIAPGWHVNANPPNPDYMIATALEVKPGYGVSPGKIGYHGAATDQGRASRRPAARLRRPRHADAAAHTPPRTPRAARTR